MGIREEAERQIIEGARDLEVRSVRNAVWKEGGDLCLAVQRGVESSGSAREPAKPTWPFGAVFVFLGGITLLFGLRQTAPPPGGLGAKGLPAELFLCAVGLIFIGTGFAVAASYSRLTLDRKARRWTLERGLRPFLRREAGAMEGLRFEMTAGTRGGRKRRPESVWMLRLVGVPTPAQTLELPAFDLRRDYVAREQAREVYDDIAAQTGFPLTEASDGESGTGVTAA